MKNLASIVIAVVALVVGGFAYFHQAPQQQPVGGAGPDFYSRLFAHNGFTSGGNVLATTSAGAVTYTAANIANNSLIEHNATAALTATLPTAAALNSIGFLPNAGDTAFVAIHASTTNITLAGGVGTNLSGATSSVVYQNDTSVLEFIRLPKNEGFTISVKKNN